jgi:hypothetical protein
MADERDMLKLLVDERRRTELTAHDMDRIARAVRGHIMHIADPVNPGVPGPGNYRALCMCGGLDGPERARRDEAVGDHEQHLLTIAAAALGYPT